MINRSTQLRKYPVTIADHNGKSSRKNLTKEKRILHGQLPVASETNRFAKTSCPVAGGDLKLTNQKSVEPRKKKNTLTFHKKLVAYIEILIMAYYNPLIPAYPIYSK